MVTFQKLLHYLVELSSRQSFILGVNFFAGRFYKCIDVETGDRFSHEVIPNRTVCEEVILLRLLRLILVLDTLDIFFVHTLFHNINLNFNST